MTALDDWPVDELERVVRRAAPFAGLTRPVLEAVLDMLAGRYPGEEFAGLRPRIVWDRVTGVIHGRPGAQRLAVTSGGTIPDRGLVRGVPARRRRRRQAAAPGRRARRGDGVRVAGRRRVRARRLVVADRGHHAGPGAGRARARAAGEAAVLARRHPGPARRAGQGDRGGGPRARQAARGAGHRPAARGGPGRARGPEPGAGTWPTSGRPPGTCPTTGRWWWSGSGTSSATGGSCCTARTGTGCTRRGRWRSPRGCGSGTAGWTCRRCTPTTGSSSGCPTPMSRRRPGSRCSTRMRSADIITAEVGGSAMFASRFRECAARALLLPRRQPGRRTPLWQQRQRSAQLLEIAAQYPGFPIVLETVRECLQDVFDVPALTGRAAGPGRPAGPDGRGGDADAEPVRRSRCCSGTSARSCTRATRRWPSGARRRWRSTRRCWPSCSAPRGCASCWTPRWWRRPSADLQHLSPGRRCRDLEGVADLLRTSGPLTAAEVAARCADAAELPTAGSRACRRPAASSRCGSPAQPMWAAIEDAGRLRDALGVRAAGRASPRRSPSRCPTRWATWWRAGRGRTARSGADALAQRYGLGVAVVTMALRRLAADGRVVEGEFTTVPP